MDIRRSDDRTEQRSHTRSDGHRQGTPEGDPPCARQHAGAAGPGSHRAQQLGLGTILLIVLILILVGVIPSWPHSKGWGYGPSGIVGVILVVLVILLLMGKL